MRDLAALVTALATNPKYDADVRGGHNWNLVRMLNAEDAGLPKRRKSISSDDFVAAITSETLTADQHAQILLYLATGVFPMHKPAVSAWFQAQGFSGVTTAAIDALSEVAGKPADAAVLADQSGSIVVDVNRSTYAGFPTLTSIAGTELPTLASAQKNQDLTLSSWTTTIAAGDVLEFEVDSITTVERVTVAIRGRKT